MKQLNFTFTEQEANLILGALGRMPFAEVTGIISNIQQQASPQMRPKETEKEKVGKTGKP